MFSLIETAKDNSLDPYRYLTWVLNEAPKLAVTDPDRAASLVLHNAPRSVRCIQINMILHLGAHYMLGSFFVPV